MLEMAAHSYVVANAEAWSQGGCKTPSTGATGSCGVYQVIEEHLRIDPWETSERKELDDGTTVRRLAFKGAGEDQK